MRVGLVVDHPKRDLAGGVLLAAGILWGVLDLRASKTTPVVSWR